MLVGMGCGEQEFDVRQRGVGEKGKHQLGVTSTWSVGEGRREDAMLQLHQLIVFFVDW